MTDFGSQFIESRGEPIAFEGNLVHMSHVMGSLPAGVLTIRMRAQGEVEQGIRLSVDGGWLALNGEKTKDVALWCETTPEEVRIEVKPMPGRESASVRVWNIWRHPGGAR